MSDHEFERQVRQKLADLRLTPTPQAWENIEAKLPGRRRRSPLFWLPLMMAGMAVAGYFLFDGGKKNPESGFSVLPNTPMQHPNDAKKGINGRADDFNEAERNSSPVSKTIHQPPFHSVKNQTDRTRPNSLHANLPVSVSRNRRLIAAEKKISDSPDVADPFETSPSIADNTAEQAKTEESDSKLGKNSIALSQAPADQKVAPSIATTLPRKTPDSKWAYAAHVSSGVSAENEGGLFGFGRPKVEDIAYTTTFAATVVNYAPVYKPSTISPGLTFSAGAEVKRTLSKRFSVSAGLDYTQMNSRLNVGDKVNSSNIVNNGIRGYLYVQSYYQLDQNEKEYKNKYHFIELPVTLHTRINNSTSLPVYWDAGLIVSRLLSSTSLHFDGTTGVYYKNDRLLNQTQAAIATGFSFAFFNKTTHPLWIGPSARSNVSSVLRKDVSPSRHFVTLGLDVKLFLNK